jgi:hypothetical protein
MAIKLSNLTFTEQDDIVPVFGVEVILNTGIANTLAGNDRITGISTSPNTMGPGISGIHNIGTLNTSDGNQGKRILSITRGLSTITRLYCCLLRTVFPPVALWSLLRRYIWEFRN